MNGDVSHGGGNNQGPNGVYVKAEIGESSKQKIASNQALQNGVRQSETTHLSNGAPAQSMKEVAAQRLLNGLKDMPPEIEQIAREHYVSLGMLIGNKAQSTWDTLLRKVDRLANIHVPPQAQPLSSATGKPLSNGLVQTNTKVNQDKKEELLNFANDQKADLIKLLVLLHWSKDVEDVSKVIDLNRWLRDRISHYGQVSDHFAALKRYMASIQTPNPDLKTASEVLSLHKVPGFSKLNYVPLRPITNKRALKTLRSLNHLLCSRLTLHEDLPTQLRRYRVHDGRVTFCVENEFDLDVSVLDEKSESQFYMADFRFAFFPSSDVPTGRLFDELCFTANEILGKNGLSGCYDFLHDFTLSYKINVLHKQALELLQGQWSDNLKVEVIHRTLIVQYWTHRQGPKNWIEIGIKSGRRKKGEEHVGPKHTALGIRWMQGSKEIEDAGIALNLHELSMDTLLREVIAKHTNRMFDSIFDNLFLIPIYATGDLELEQSASSTEPNECSITISLSKSKRIKLSLETVTGAIVLTPTSGLVSQIEQELNRAKHLADDTPQRLSFLRCRSAEDDLVALAEASGWVVLRGFRPTATETRTLFPPHVLRSIFLRRSYWEAGYMVAATYGPEGDQWWLVEQSQASANQGQWQSQMLQTKSRHLLKHLSSAYMRRMADYTTGLVIIQQNAWYLSAMGIRCKLHPVPPFTEGKHAVELPKISLEFQPAKLRPMLEREYQNTTDFSLDDLNLSQGLDELKGRYIRNGITIKYGGIESSSNRAKLIVVGRSNANSRTLHYLAKSIDDPNLQFGPADGSFSLCFGTSVGQPAVSELLRNLLHLETIIACAEVVQAQSSMAVTSVSLAHISIRYRAAPPADLGLTIRFATASSPLSLRLSPEHGNPHDRIQKELSKELTLSRQSLSACLDSHLPLLSQTYHLLTLFDQIQSEKYAENFEAPIGQDAVKLAPRIHIMPRDCTMYGLQFFAPAGFIPPAPSGPHRATGMIARFEIFSTIRRGVTKWILRAALEEFETYSQPSYCAQSLKDKIKAEIFAVTRADGWLPLDSGAAFDADSPEPLLKSLMEVVMAWMKEYAAAAGAVEVAPVPAPGPAPVVTNGVPKVGAGSKTNNSGGGKKITPQQQGREVITLD